jgi:hypothetical protein
METRTNTEVVKGVVCDAHARQIFVVKVQALTWCGLHSRVARMVENRTENVRFTMCFDSP